jgi:hypothetical protein
VNLEYLDIHAKTCGMIDYLGVIRIFNGLHISIECHDFFEVSDSDVRLLKVVSRFAILVTLVGKDHE